MSNPSETHEVVVAIHELWDRHGEIPNVPDCYLVGIWNEQFPEDSVDEEDGCHPLGVVPFFAAKFDALQAAQDFDLQVDFTNQWPATGIFRIGRNGRSVEAPVYLRFRWGLGHPKIDGIEVLIHEKGLQYGHWCDHCHCEMGRTPTDCPTRRLRALATATDPKEIDQHRRAVELWHSPKSGDNSQGVSQ